MVPTPLELNIENVVEYQNKKTLVEFKTLPT